MRAHHKIQKQVLIKTKNDQVVKSGNTIAFGILSDSELREIRRKKKKREAFLKEDRFDYFIAQDLKDPNEQYPITKAETKKSITAYNIDVQTRPLIEDHMANQKKRGQAQKTINKQFIRTMEVDNEVPRATTNYVIRNLIREEGWKFDPPRGNRTITRTINATRRSV